MFHGRESLKFGASFFVLLLAALQVPSVVQASVQVSNSFIVGLARSGDSVSDNQVFTGTAIPAVAAINVVSGANSSDTDISYFTSGNVTTFSFDFEHSRGASQFNEARTRSLQLSFNTSTDATYEVSGFYNVDDTLDGDSGSVFLGAVLKEDGANILRAFELSFFTSDETFKLGQQGGDNNSGLEGSLTGNLVANRRYDFTFDAIIDSFSALGGASAVGNVTLKVIEHSAVPEPSLFVVWAVLACCGAAKRQR